MADLTGFQPRHDSFVGVDSDGCVFDTMEIKQKQCFHGLIVSHWKLEAVEKPVRQAAEFVNLYSTWRGQNRFMALLQMFHLLADHPEIRRRGFPLPSVGGLQRFVAGGKLTEAALRGLMEQTGDPELALLYRWNLEVNAAIARTVKRIPPFPWAHKSLERIRRHSDAACVSQTPTEALVREWEENGLAGLIDLIAGQELGTKAEHLALATQGRYPAERVLMIGDAQGDRKAAESNGACFFPINPAHEDASWKRFFEEGYDRFLAGTFLGPYQDGLVREFESLLPDIPPWAGA
ncbi:MAG: HAD family hydrolase [Lentisphaerae bacterium]|nr:HAD family hydrolase [Lentisphaerota bacterium]